MKQRMGLIGIAALLTWALLGGPSAVGQVDVGTNPVYHENVVFGTGGAKIDKEGDADFFTLSVQGAPVLASGLSPLTIGDGTAGATLNLNGAVANNRIIQGQTGATNRWRLILGTDAAEGGSNVGSDFQLRALSDAGAAIDTVIDIQREAGGLITLGRNVETELSSTGTVQYAIRNTNVGAGATTALILGNTASGTEGQIQLLGTGYTTVGAFVQDSLLIYASSTASGGLNLVAGGGTSDVGIYAGGFGTGDKVATFDDALLTTLVGDLIVDGGDIGLTGDSNLLGLAPDAFTVNGTLATTDEITTTKTLAGTLSNVMVNDSTAANALARFYVANLAGSTNAVVLATTGRVFTPSGAFKGDAGMLFAHLNLAGGLSIGAFGAAADVRLYAGGSADGDLVATFDDALLTTLAGDLIVDGGDIGLTAKPGILELSTAGLLVNGTATSTGALITDAYLQFAEVSAPTPVTNYGQLYTTTANDLRFIDGAGGDHLVHSDSYSDIWFHGAASTLTISATETFTQVTQFENVGEEDDRTNSVGSASTNDIVLGANAAGIYDVKWHASILVAGGSAKTILVCPGITLATPIVIASATAATPIVITTTGNHLLQNGDMFTVTGATGDTAVNGDFVASAVTATTIALIDLDRDAVATAGTYDASTGSIVIEYPGDMLAQAVISGTALEHVSAPGNFSLSAADVIELYIANLDGTENVDVTLVNLEVTRIGD